MSNGGPSPLRRSPACNAWILARWVSQLKARIFAHRLVQLDKRCRRAGPIRTRAGPDGTSDVGRWDSARATWAAIEMVGQLIIARGLGGIRATVELPRERHD